MAVLESELFKYRNEYMSVLVSELFKYRNKYTTAKILTRQNPNYSNTAEQTNKLEENQHRLRACQDKP